MAFRACRALRTILQQAGNSRAVVASANSSFTRIYNLSTTRTLSTISHVKYISPRQISVNIRRNFASDHEEENVEEETMNVLKLFDKVDPSKVALEAHFINDLGLDSLDVVEVVMAFEDEFGIEISDEEAEKIFTVQQAVELIKAKLDS